MSKKNEAFWLDDDEEVILASTLRDTGDLPDGLRLAKEGDRVKIKGDEYIVIRRTQSESSGGGVTFFSSCQAIS